jgi:predicted kinase
MNSVIIILGDHARGKSQLARKISANKRTVYVSDFMLKSGFAFSDITKDTEVILIDELSFKYLNEFMLLITSETIVIEKKGLNPVEIIRPKIIAVSNSLSVKDFSISAHRSYISIIEL